MFRAIGKFFRTIGYLFTGKINRISEIWARNPAVVAATFDRATDEMTSNVNKYMNALAQMVTTEEKKKAQLKDVNEKIAKLTNQKAAAGAKAKQLVDSLGGDVEKVKANPEYSINLNAYTKFATELEEKAKQAEEIEGELEQTIKNIAEHRIQLQSWQRKIQKLKEEKSETIADILAAEQEKKIADMLSGISEGTMEKDLQGMRDARIQAKADARISRELAGSSNEKFENEYLNYATASQAASEFDQLIGLTKETNNETKVETEAKISES